MELMDQAKEERSLDDYNAQLDDINNGVIHYQQEVSIELARLEATAAAPAPSPADAPIAAAHPQRIRPNDALKPFTLSRDHTPVQLRDWQQKFRDYYSSSKFEHCSVSEQQAYFKSCLDSYLSQRLHQDIQAATPIFGDGSCTEALDALFKKFYPLFTRRLDFFKSSQAPGQLFSDWTTQLRQLGDEAELDATTVDDLYAMRYLVGGVDNKLLEKLMASKDGTLADLNTIVAKYEVSQQKLTAMHKAGSSSAAAVHTTCSEKSNQQCFRCGNFGCNPTSCWAKKSVCRYCSKQGHLDRICHKRDQDIKMKKSGGKKKFYKGNNGSSNNFKSSSQFHKPSTVKAASSLVTAEGCCRVTAENATPRLNVLVQAKGTKSFLFDALPDSGATRTFISRDLVQAHNLPVDTAQKAKIKAANESPMVCDGTVTLELTADSHKVCTDALVTPAISNELLLGWKDLVTLTVIHNDFPRPLASIAMVSTTSGDPATLFSSYNDVFSTDTLRPMVGDKMKIHLTSEVKPSKVLTPRQIPLHLQASAEEELQKYLDSGVIVPVDQPTEWISPGFFVRKSDGRARLVTDFTALNRYVKRPIHPFPSAQDIRRNIEARSRIFAKLDARSGYFQIPLEEASSYLTTFLLPSGRYRYKRAPMGLSASSDEFCTRSDAALLGLPGVLKIVDDILIQAASHDELHKRLEAVLKRCRAHGITLSKDKAEVGEQVKFAGFIVTAEGTKPDPAKVKAIKDFPTPTCTRDIRSFLGLAVQLAGFIPDLAQSTNPLRQLLKKDVAFLWLPEHQAAFDQTKNLLTSNMVMSFFDPKKPTKLLTDASCLNGLGYALMQGEKLIQCGSRSLSPAEARYAVIELECCAVAWAIDACRHYLLGCPIFDVITDHRPLVGVFAKPLSALDNPRILRFREKLLDYSFNITWTQGKSHLIADALSRAPVFDAPIREASACIMNVYDGTDPALAPLQEAAKDDATYQQIMGAALKKIPRHLLPKDHPARIYKSMWDNISIESDLLIYDGCRIIVPLAQRKRILQVLHDSHSGIGKTRKLAQQLYYWPGINQDIANLISSCEKCQEMRPSQGPEPIISRTASYPMESVSIDPFEAAGKKYLVMVDRYSSYPFVARLNSTVTSSITSIITDWFLEVGWPRIIGSDGGPQFRSAFEDFCREHNILHQLSSAGHPKSNGLAEAGVKDVKNLLLKNDSWHAFKFALQAFRNVPRTGPGLSSPAELFFGRRHRLPVLPALTIPLPLSHKDNNSGRHLPPLQIGQKVYLQNGNTKRWDCTGVIKKVREHGRSYIVIRQDGRELLRNRIYLKPVKGKVQSQTKPQASDIPQYISNRVKRRHQHKYK